MLIVDERADMTFLEHLRHLRDDDHSTRYIHFHLNPNDHRDGWKQASIAAARNHLNHEQTTLYFCEDGSLAVLFPPLPNHPHRQFIRDVALACQRAPHESWITSCELWDRVNKLIVDFTQQLEKRRQERELMKRESDIAKAQRLAEKKRHAILDASPSAANSDPIDVRRKARETLELMMVEDDAFSRRLVENAIQKLHKITCLPTADKALETYSKHAPDLLFLDICLPDVTGHELLERIMALDPDAHVIMLSGNSDKASIMRAMELGAKGFIAKPFSKEKLLRAIEICSTQRNKKVKENENLS